MRCNMGWKIIPCIFNPAPPGHYTGMPDKTLTVWIPAQLAESLEELHAQTFSASLTVQELSATRLNLQSVSGLTELYEVEAEEANFSSVSGDMTWDGVIQAVTMRTTSRKPSKRYRARRGGDEPHNPFRGY